MLNRVTLIGRITNNLELRKASNGNPYCAFTLAVNDVFSNNTSFISCFAWNKTSENMTKYLRKGSLVSVDGILQSRSVENNGQRQTVINVRADNVSFLESKGTAQQNDSATFTSQQPSFSSNSNNTNVNQQTNVQSEYNNQNNGITFDGDDAILWD